MPQIELLGLARQYAGVDRLESTGENLEQVLRELGTQCPSFAARCSSEALLPAGLIVCLNERRFTADLTVPIGATDRVLILSADVGG